MREADDLRHVIDRAYGIRGVAHRNQPGAPGDLAGQIVHVESAVVFVNPSHANGHAALFEGAPRRNVGVVIKMGEHDFVPRAEFAPDGAAHGEGQRSHVGSEDDLVRVAAQEVRHGRTCARNHRVGVAAGRVSATSVGVVAFQIIGDSVNHALWDLSSARTVEKSRRLAVNDLRERRELGTDPGQIERICGFSLHCGHDFILRGQSP